MVKTGAGRLLSLDVFRGITMASMVMVNNAGDGRHVYPQLRHASWHGWTFTDMVFPFFLWIVGVALTLSSAKRVERGEDRGQLVGHAFQRAAVIFLIGLALNAFPSFEFATLRIPGVLQRIAICYLIATIAYLYLRVRGLVVALIATFALYTVLMHPGGYERGGNMEETVDSWLLPGHLYANTKVYDPEGVVSTLPAIGTALFGVLTGLWLRTKREGSAKVAAMLGAGVALVVLAYLADPVQPINKNLWTASYATLMAGLALIVFAACYWILDVKQWRQGMTPFVMLGMNALAVYILSGVLADVLGTWTIGGITAKQFLYERLFAPLASPVNASLLYALANVAVCWLAAWFMYRRGWFFKA